ncbi:O-acyltransferase like protein-like [Bemisia tabaci]|uniref:O-acyltransferase like protein-like n=1 Tax=Bemisia tabaci TaxID=7038 RepID=UPI003B289401
MTLNDSTKMLPKILSVLTLIYLSQCKSIESSSSSNNSIPFSNDSYVSRNASEKWSSFPKLAALRDELSQMNQNMSVILSRGKPENATSERTTQESETPAASPVDEEVRRVMNTDIPKKSASQRMAEEEAETIKDGKENRKIDRNVDDIILVASNSDAKETESSNNQTAEENAENARMLGELKAKLAEIGNEGEDIEEEDNDDREVTFGDIVGDRALDIDDDYADKDDSDLLYGHSGKTQWTRDTEDEDEKDKEGNAEKESRARRSAEEKRSLGEKEVMEAAEAQNLLRASAPFMSDFRGTPVFRPNSSHSLVEVLDLYNPSRLADKWRMRNPSSKLSPSCEADTELYLTALKNGMPWAAKMSDASGKYSSSFFWGNQYWMGSKTLCSQIQAPFPLGFSVVRGHLTLNTIDSQTRAILVGICLPHSCLKEDIEVLFNWSVKMDPAAYERSFELKQVRTPQQYYNMFHDSTFWLLAVTCAIVGLLMISATILDFYLDSPCSNGSMWKHKCFAYDNYSYEIAKTPQHTSILNGQTCQGIKIDPSDANLKTDAQTPLPAIEKNIILVDNGGFKVPEIVTDILLAFSVRRNMAQICDKKVDIDTLPTVHGLRAINMAWVILGHTCIIAFKYSDNMEYKRMIEKEFLFQAINNAAFAVDSFFFISGLLVSFLYFRTTARMDVTKITKTTGIKSNCLEFVGLLIYRFGRLTTPYFFMIGVVEVAMKWFYYNSVFEVPADDHVNCPNYWWRNILYINTLFPVKDMCMIWSWYLANDTQFYIIGVILLIVAVKRFRIAAVVMTFFLVTSWFVTGFIAYTNKHIPNVDDPLALFDKIYDKPWTRFGPYMVGMSVGWILFKTDCSIKFSKRASICGWTASTLGLLGLLVGLYGQDLHPVTAASYSALSHSLWALCLAWIVIACSTGKGGVVNRFLSSPLWYPYSRVTYCAYLVHPIVMRSMVMTRDSPVHLSVITITVFFFGQLVVSYIFSFLLSLAFEAPVVSLLRLISPKKEKRQS